MPPRKSAPTTIAKVVSIDTADRAAVLARRDELFHSFAERVPEIAARIKQRLPSCFELDDLISAGYLGLLRAATTYRNYQLPGYSQPVPFASHAYQIVQGFILTSVRPRSRNSRDSINNQPFSENPAAEQVLFNSEGNEGAASYRGAVALAMQVATRHDREMDLDAAELHRRIAAAVAQLPGPLQQLIELYYSQEKTMLEISQAFGVNESRISQLHHRAIRQIHEILIGVPVSPDERKKPRVPRKQMGKARLEDLPPEWQQLIRKLLSA